MWGVKWNVPGPDGVNVNLHCIVLKSGSNFRSEEENRNWCHETKELFNLVPTPVSRATGTLFLQESQFEGKVFIGQTFLHRRPKLCCGCCRLEKDVRLTSSVISSGAGCHLMWGLMEHGEVLTETSSWDRARITPKEQLHLTSWNVITWIKPFGPLCPFS